MMWIWSALTSKLAGPIATAVAVSLALTLLFTSIKAAAVESGLRGQAKAVQTQLDAANKNLSICHGNNATLSAAIDKQNQSVKALGDASDKATSAAKAAVSLAQSTRAAVDSKVGELLATKPPAGANQCVAADALILDSLK